MSRRHTRFVAGGNGNQSVPSTGSDSVSELSPPGTVRRVGAYLTSHDRVSLTRRSLNLSLDYRKV